MAKDIAKEGKKVKSGCNKKAIAELSSALEMLNNGEFNINLDIKDKSLSPLAEQINLLGKKLNGMSADMLEMGTEVTKGNLEHRVSPREYPNGFGEIIDGMNTSMDMTVSVVRRISDKIVALGNGDFNAKIVDNFNGEFNMMKDAINNLSDGLMGLLKDSELIADAVGRGEATFRVNTSGYQGDLEKIGTSLNGAFDVFSMALDDIIDVLRELQKGNFDASVEREWNGDFDVIKNAANGTAAKLKDLLASYDKEYQEIKQGNIQSRISTDGFEGGYLELIAVVNNTLFTFFPSFAISFAIFISLVFIFIYYML